MEFIKLAGIGLVLGITTTIPGVSVGTIAVVLNVFYRLIEVITPNIKKILAAWKFLLPLIIGVIAGIIIFSRVITFLYANYRVPTYWFFIGIIVGSLPLLYRRVCKPDSVLPVFSSVICGFIALALMIVLAILKPGEEAAVSTVLTPQLFGTLTIGGVLAAIAMIIPGISGTFLLLVIGLYRTIIQAVSDFNIPLIAPVGLGAIIGLLSGAAFVRFLMKKVPKQTYGAVLGLVVGSVIVLYPGGLGSGITIIFSVLSMLVGGTISFVLGRQKE